MWLMAIICVLYPLRNYSGSLVLQTGKWVYFVGTYIHTYRQFARRKNVLFIASVAAWSDSSHSECYLIEYLISVDTCGYLARETNCSVLNCYSNVLIVEIGSVTPDLLKENLRHFPSVVGRNEKGRNKLRRCQLCKAHGRGRKRTRVFCAACPGQPGLCVGACFKKFHEIWWRKSSVRSVYKLLIIISYNFFFFF